MLHVTVDNKEMVIFKIDQTVKKVQRKSARRKKSTNITAQKTERQQGYPPKNVTEILSDFHENNVDRYSDSTELESTCENDLEINENSQLGEVKQEVLSDQSKHLLQISDNQSGCTTQKVLSDQSQHLLQTDSQSGCTTQKIFSDQSEHLLQTLDSQSGCMTQKVLSDQSQCLLQTLDSQSGCTTQKMQNTVCASSHETAGNDAHNVSQNKWMF